MTRRLLVVSFLVFSLMSGLTSPTSAGEPEGPTDREQRALELWREARGAQRAPEVGAAGGNSTADPTGDTSDGEDPRGDVRQIGAIYDFESVILGFNVAEGSDPATDPSWTEGATAALWVVDVDNDGVADYLVIMLANPDGSLTAAVLRPVDEDDVEVLCEGSAAFNGTDGYLVQFPAGCIGFPPTFSFGLLFLFQTDPEDPAAVQADLAPNDVLAGPVPRGNLPIPATNGRGYWIAAADGGIFAFGDAGFHGSLGSIPLVQPILGMFPTPSASGYWMGASDGGIFALGDADFFGSMGDRPLNQPIVGVASTPTGRGYWMVARDGGIFAFGDASFFGSMGDRPLNQPIVGMSATPTGRGYWMVAADGGMFAFGDAAFFGSMGNQPLNQPITGMATAPSGQGYWLVAADGGIFAFGAGARFFGSGVTEGIANPLIAVTRTGNGYWLLDKNTGRVEAFGDAVDLADLAGLPLNEPIVAFARTP